MPAFLILALLMAMGAVIFALQNTAPVAVSLFLWDISGSLALVLLATLTVGIVVGLLFQAPALIRNRLKISRQRKVIADLERRLLNSTGYAVGQSNTTPGGSSSRTAPGDYYDDGTRRVS